MAKAVWREIPRIFANQLTDRAKHATLDHETAMPIVIAMQSTHAFNRDAVQHHHVFTTIYPPAFHTVHTRHLMRHRNNADAQARKLLRPQPD